MVTCSPYGDRRERAMASLPTIQVSLLMQRPTESMWPIRSISASKSSTRTGDFFGNGLWKSGETIRGPSNTLLLIQRGIVCMRPDQLDGPSAMALWGDKLYVVSTFSDRVSQISLGGGSKR